MLKSMLRVKFSFEQRNPCLAQVDVFARNSHLFANYGINVCDSGQDLLVAHHAELANITGPTVMIERADSCIMANVHTRKLAENDNVLAVVKTTSSKPISINNCGFSRYHFKLLSESSGIVDDHNLELMPDLSPTALSKIHCWLPICTQNIFRKMKDLSVDFDAPRNIDVNYLVKPWSRSELLGYHRESIADVLKGMNVNKVVGPTISREYWVSLLLDSKICVSPWGWGEMCHRDFDAIYSGCVLLKPDSNHMLSVPDIYKPDFYVPFKPDCSDLAEKVQMILDDWPKYHEMRVRARETILAEWDKNQVELWANKLKGLL